MSPGNRQKLSLLLAVCHHPELLLLDEPLSSLDAIVRLEVIDALLEHYDRDHGVILISSHLLSDLERIADRIVILDKGRILEDASLDALKDKYGTNLEQMFRTIAGAAA
jgi:ABC-2 type transport system ATP-binding protein